MSVQSSAIMFISVIAIALAAHRAEDARTGRRPASTKAEYLKLDHHSGIKHTHKLSGPVQSEIDIVGARPEKAGDVFVMKGSLRMSANVTDVRYKWILPEGVELVNGTLEDVIPSMSAGEPQDVQITVRQLTSDNAQIHFQVLASEGGRRSGQTAQYNTLLQEVLKSSLEELRKSTEEHAAQDSVTKPRMFH